MKNISKIREIEENYNLNTITSDNVPIWQYIRNLLYSQKINDIRSNRLKDFYLIMANRNWGNYNSSKNYKYVLFTDSREEMIENNHVIDKTSQNLIDILGKGLMVVVNPSGKKHLDSKKYQYNHMSSSFFHYKRWSSFYPKSKKIENLNDLKKILKKFKIDLDINYYNRLFFIYVDIFSNWLIEVSPKAVFINCYYSLFHQALIFACKKNKIKTIEIQHGLISDSHNQYSPNNFIGMHTMPNYLMCYNEYVKGLTNKNYIDAHNIIPVGHYYVERKLRESTAQIKSKFQSYNKLIAVSTQDDLERELISRIEEIAVLKKDWMFIIKPRDRKSIKSRFKNIIIDIENDIYSLIKESDFHISCYSTVALESSMMGTPTILININNMSKLYFGSIIKIFENIKISNSNNDILGIIDNWKMSKEKKMPYILDNRKNIECFLNKHIKE